MRNGENQIDELFEAARTKPTELGLEDVSKMVAGFPLTPTPFDWSSIINLNSIIMTSVSAFIIAGSFMLYTGSAQNPAANPETQGQEPIAQGISSTKSGSSEHAEATESYTSSLHSPAVAVEASAQADTSLDFIEETSQIIAAAVEPEESEPVAEIAVNEDADRTLIVISDNESTASINDLQTDVWEANIPESDAEEVDPEFNEPRNMANMDYDDGRMEFNVSDFRGISVSGSFEVHVKQSNTFKVYAEGKDEALEKLDIEVKNGNLHISTKKKNSNNCNSYSSCENVEVVVEMPTFDNMSVAGSGEMIIHSFTDLGDVDFSVAGSGSIDVDGDLEMSGDADISIAGSGEMNLDGTARRANISIAGSGDFNGLDLRVRDADISIAGSGEIGIHAEESLDISIAGSGDVEYMGDPKIEKSIMGSGDIRRH